MLFAPLLCSQSEDERPPCKELIEAISKQDKNHFMTVYTFIFNPVIATAQSVDEEVFFIVSLCKYLSQDQYNLI